MIDYSLFWKTLEQKGISQYQLIYKMNVDSHTVTRLRQNKSITMNTLETLCTLLDCTPNDIVTFTKVDD